MSHEDWYCLQTVPAEERRCFDQLTENGWRAWFPRILVRSVRWNKPQERIEPLFRSYLFVAFATDAAWGPILRIPGVRRLFVSASGAPQRLRAGEVERLMAFGADGLVEPPAPGSIHLGDQVRVIAGPFAGWCGVWSEDPQRRIGVLMTMFNGARVVPMPLDHVEVA